MAKHSFGWVESQKWWLLAFLVLLYVSFFIAFFVRAAFNTCDRNLDGVDKRIPYGPLLDATPNLLSFMKSKLVLLISHELSLSVKNVIEKPHNDHLPLIEASKFLLASLCLYFLYYLYRFRFLITPILDSFVISFELLCQVIVLFGKTASFAIWASFLTYLKSFALPFAIVECSWKLVKRLKISGKL